MADPLKNPGRWSAYSYTFATGKRPNRHTRGEWTWFDIEQNQDEGEDYVEECDDLPADVYARLKGGDRDRAGWVDYPSYLEAIAAANDAARRAIADGAWKPEAA